MEVRFLPPQPLELACSRRRAERKEKQGSKAMAYELKLFSGNANRPLAEEIAKTLHVPLGDADVSRFSDGEVYVQINENVRGQDIFVIQPTCPPVNDHLMELLVMIDAFKRASARRITAVLPYYGYGRQDRKVAGRACRSPPSWWPTCSPPRARQRRARGGPPRRPDPGLLRHPGGPPLRGAPGDHRLPGEEGPEGPGPRLARRGRRGARAGASPSGSRRASPSSTSGARAPTSRRSCTSSATSRTRTW